MKKSVKQSLRASSFLLVIVLLSAALAACSNRKIDLKALTLLQSLTTASEADALDGSPVSDLTAPKSATAETESVTDAEPTTSGATASGLVPEVPAVISEEPSLTAPAPSVTETTSAAQTATTAASNAAERTVYVSRNGVIHSLSNCSGMRYYREMTLSEAQNGGYRKCQRCW